MKPQRRIGATFENTFLSRDEGRREWNRKMQEFYDAMREAEAAEAERQAQLENGQAA